MADDALPSSWRLVKLGDLGEVNRGRSRHRPRYAEHLYGGPYPFIQTGDIKSSEGRITSYQQTYSEAGLAQSRMWPSGAMCITIAANIAETGILAFPACFPDSVVGFIADDSKCDVRFVEFTFRHLRQQIQHEASGSVQDNINLATLDRLRFPLPPLPEQRAIAHILGTLDDKIERNRRMNETLEAMARSLFKSWFVDFDPVRAKAEGRDPGLPQPLAGLFPDSFEDSDLGEIPKGWETGNLADLSTLNPESWSKATRPTLINYVDLSNTKWGRIESVTTYAQEDAPSRAQRVLQSRDTIVGTVRPGNGSYVLVSDDGLTGSTGFAVLRPTNTVCAEFVYLAATTAENIEALSHLADGGAYPAVRPEVVAATKIIRPRNAVLVSFSRVAGPLLGKLAGNERQSRTLAALRDALLPKLISGELRVPFQSDVAVKGPRHEKDQRT